MLPRTLFPEKEVRVKSLQEVEELVKTDFLISQIDTSLENLEIREDGIVRLGSTEMQYTPFFLESLARRIEMPLGYAYKIDFDLFRTNFDQRKQQACSGVRVCTSRGVAINLVPAPYEPARTLDVIAGLPQKFRSWVFHEGVVSDRGVEVSWVDGAAEIGPEPGDTILAGVRLSNSETGFRGLKAALYTLRLVCRNGAVVADEEQVVRWSYDRRVTYTRNIEKFCEELEILELPQKELADRYKNLAGRKILDQEAPPLWRRIRRVVGPDDADRILGVSGEERRGLFARMRQQGDARTAEPTELDAYELHNRITALSREYGFPQWRRLEEIGGDMLRDWPAGSHSTEVSGSAVAEGGPVAP